MLSNLWNRITLRSTSLTNSTNNNRLITTQRARSLILTNHVSKLHEILSDSWSQINYTRNDVQEVIDVILDLKLLLVLESNRYSNDPLVPSRIRFLRKFPKRSLKAVRRINKIQKRLQQNQCDNQVKYWPRIQLHTRKLMHLYITALDIDKMSNQRHT